MALTQESILSFLLEHGGKVRNSELLNNFRSHISCSDPAEKQHNRDLFKKLVNSVAVVKQVDEVKFVVAKRRYQDFVKDLTHDVAQKTQPDCSFSSLNASFLSPHGAESTRAVYADFENNNVRNPTRRNGNYCSDAKRAPVESMRKKRQLSRSVSTADTTAVRVLNISGDQASRAGRSGAVFAVIAVKSPQRAAAAAAQDGSHSQVHQRNTISLGSKVSSRSVPALNLAACKKDALRESQDTGCPQVRPQSKTTRSADEAKDCGSVPLEPLAHEWLVKCAAGLWGQVHALLLRDTSLAQKKDFMSGFTALHWAAKDGNNQMMQEILDICKKRDTCVNINSKAHGGYTPLHIAAIHGHAEVMLLLVQSYGASVNERDNDGKKAFYYLGKGASAELRAVVGGMKPSREKTEDEEYKEQTKSFNTISKLFQPHMGKKQKTKFAHDW